MNKTVFEKRKTTTCTGYTVTTSEYYVQCQWTGQKVCLPMNRTLYEVFDGDIKEPKMRWVPQDNLIFPEQVF